MRILYLANNRLGWKVLEWLREQPGGNRRAGPSIRRTGSSSASRSSPPRASTTSRSSMLLSSSGPPCSSGSPASSPSSGSRFCWATSCEPACSTCCPPAASTSTTRCCPTTAGANSNVWTIVDGTPAGASLHWIDAGVDTGDLIDQREVEVEPIDTGASLYRKLETAGLALFQESWPALAPAARRGGRSPPAPAASTDGATSRRSTRFVSTSPPPRGG